MSELTKEESESLSKLVDPDREVKVSYNWEEDFQREILSLLLTQRDFLVESIALVEPNYFPNESHKMIADILFGYFEKYKTIPSKAQIVEEMKLRIDHRPDDLKAKFYTELNFLLTYFVPGCETRVYYRQKIVNFAKAQAMRIAFKKCVEELKKGPDSEDTWIKIDEILKQARSVDMDFEKGLDYFADPRERYERRKDMIKKGDVFTSGFEAIDSALKNGGLIRGEMGSWMASSGGGKSLALITGAIANLNRGKKVMYVTLEIDQDAVADRFDAQLANFRENKGVTIKNLLEKQELVIESLNDYVKEYDDKTRLVIKRFAGGSLDVQSFIAYFSQTALHGFRPDLVIIDYIGEMKDYPGIPTHESRYRITRDLRGFAVDEMVVVLTAMQPNKTGKETVRNGLLMDDENLGDSNAQIKPLDAFWTINQLLDEKDAGIARVNIAKHRDGASRFAFWVQFDYNTLAIRQISESKYDSIYKRHMNTKEETVADMAKKEIEKRGFKRSDGEAPLKGKFANASYSIDDVVEEK